MKKTEAQRREKMVTMRVTPEEKEIIKAAAARRNQPVSHMIYELTMAEAERLGVSTAISQSHEG